MFPPSSPVYRPDKAAICLAVLRRDGFISLDADVAEGWVITQRFAASSPSIFVNPNAQEGDVLYLIRKKLRLEHPHPDSSHLTHL